MIAFYSLGASRDFLLISSQGKIVGSLTLPRTVIIRSLVQSTLYGVERDADDLESVVRFRVQLPTSR